ncbi:Pleckstrin homology domain-containing protein [Fusarium oxysporum]|nr:Pleckstrin homology domain-containing protein [Fusarium oxysporum]
MAEEQKNVEVPQEIKPETAPAPVNETPTEALATEDKPAEEDKPTETEKSKTENKEIKPIEEGHLGHKAHDVSFPRSLIASKEFFFFGTDAFEPKALTQYLKTEKSAETAHSNIAWASHTGQGLLFFGDKMNPSGIISLADATEPEIDASHKFHFTSKGNKHSFRAANTAERDNWVAQLKLKIAEAKELATTVTEPPRRHPRRSSRRERITRMLQKLEDRVESLENQLKDMKDMTTKMDNNMGSLMGMFKEFMKVSAVTSEATK